MNIENNFTYISPKEIEDSWVEDETIGGEIKFKCPRCGHNSASYNVLKQVGNCLRNKTGLCGLKTIKLHNAYDHVSPVKLFPSISKYHKLPNQSSDKEKKPMNFNLQKLSTEALNYLASRRITPSAIQFFNELYEVEHLDSKWIAWRAFGGDLQLRSIEGNLKKTPSGHKQNFSVFGSINQSKTLVIVEGLISGMSHYELLEPENCLYIVLNSTSNMSKFLYAAPGFNRLGFEKFMLGLDNDKAGISSTATLEQFCIQNKFDYEISHVPIPGGDWNDLLMKQTVTP